MSLKKILAAAAVIAVALFMGVQLHNDHLLPREAAAQTSSPDVYAVFSNTATGATPATILAAASSKARVRVKAIVVSSTSSGAVSLYDGNSTVIMSIPVLANTPTTISPSFFFDGAGSLGGPVCTAGNALKVLQPAGGTVNLTVRCEND